MKKVLSLCLEILKKVLSWCLVILMRLLCYVIGGLIAIYFIANGYSFVNNIQDNYILFGIIVIFGLFLFIADCFCVYGYYYEYGGWWGYAIWVTGYFKKLGFSRIDSFTKKHIRTFRIVMSRNDDVVEIYVLMDKNDRAKLRIYANDSWIELPFTKEGLTEDDRQLLDKLIVKEFGIPKKWALAVIPPANTSLTKIEKCRNTSLSVIYPSLASL